MYSIPEHDKENILLTNDVEAPPFLVLVFNKKGNIVYSDAYETEDLAKSAAKIIKESLRDRAIDYIVEVYQLKR